jgi:hypothetical protein
MIPFMDLHTFALACLGAILGVVCWRSWKRPRSYMPRPPGPKGLPLIGNIFDIPTEYEALAYHRYAEQYGEQPFHFVLSYINVTTGDIVYFKVLSKSILVLDSVGAVMDLLEHRGNIYSSRPELEMGNLYVTGLTQLESHTQRL